MKLLAIIEDTFREALARKTIIAFAVISTIFMVIALFVALFTSTDALLPSSAAGVKIALPQEQMVWMLEAGLASFVHFIALLLATFATASIFPNTMEKGAVDLLLSKPVSRFEIVHGKFLGGVLMVILNVSYFILGMWLIVSVKTGYWSPQFLVVIPIVSFSFIVLYTVIMVIGIASRSSALAIIICYGFLYLVSPFLAVHATGMLTFIQSPVLNGIISTIYYILPKPNDMTTLAEGMVLHRAGSLMPLWSSALFGAAMYGMSLFLFKRKDF
jgi:ABC-type transport system involved in multi-copper enzyme maturation permease subunit